MATAEEPALSSKRPGTFVLRDCALIAIATGKKVLTLKELRDGLLSITLASIYYHFWGSLLQPRFEEQEYNNDFAAWVRHGLHDGVLAERLAVVAPMEFADLEALRQELVELIEERLDESESVGWVRATQQFEFIRSQTVVFDTHQRVGQPEELAQLMPHLSTSSIFYHFIDARKRFPDGGEDFSVWLQGFGKPYQALCQDLAGIDPYFGSLSELRHQLALTFERHLGK